MPIYPSEPSVESTAISDPTGANVVAIVGTALKVDGSAVTQPVSAADLTNGNQVVKGIPTSTGQKPMSGSVAVVLASDQSTIPVSTEGAKASYSAGFSALVPAAAATDVFTIQGSATKIIRVTRIAVSITTTAGSGIALNTTLVKRSTIDSGGTSTTASLVAHDSTNTAGSAVVRGYTANPTLGTSVGTIRSNRFQVATAGATENELVWDFGTRPAQAIVLRGTSDQLCINLGGGTITGPIAAFSVEWTEE